MSVDGYNLYTKYREEGPMRSGGIAIFVHERLQRFVREIDGGSEYILWIEIKDIFPTTNSSVLLGAVYIPRENNKYWTKEGQEGFEYEVTEKCSTFEDVILTGDYNCNTGTLSEFTLNDAFKDACKMFKRLSIPLERSSNDTHRPSVNGKRLIELCQKQQVFILNGRLFSDKGIGEITCWHTHPGTVIDYVLASVKCLELFKSFKVEEVITENYNYSDFHNGLVFDLACSTLVYK